MIYIRKKIRSNNKKKGFTVLELMAVMAIILILSAAFLPKITSYINESKKTAAIGQAKKVVTAFETLRLKNSTLSEDSAINTITSVDEDLLSSTDISKLDGNLTVEDCINILDTESYSVSFQDGIITGVLPLTQ